MFNKMFGKVALVASGVLGALGSASAVEIATPLGEGITLSNYITLCITSMGSIVVTALGGYFAFLLVRRGLRWVRTAI